MLSNDAAQSAWSFLTSTQLSLLSSLIPDWKDTRPVSKDAEKAIDIILSQQHEQASQLLGFSKNTLLVRVVTPSQDISSSSSVSMPLIQQSILGDGHRDEVNVHTSPTVPEPPPIKSLSPTFSYIFENLLAGPENQVAEELSSDLDEDTTPEASSSQFQNQKPSIPSEAVISNAPGQSDLTSIMDVDIWTGQGPPPEQTPVPGDVPKPRQKILSPPALDRQLASTTTPQNDIDSSKPTSFSHIWQNIDPRNAEIRPTPAYDISESDGDNEKAVDASDFNWPEHTAFIPNSTGLETMSTGGFSPISGSTPAKPRVVDPTQLSPQEALHQGDTGLVNSSDTSNSTHHQAAGFAELAPNHIPTSLSSNHYATSSTPNAVPTVVPASAWPTGIFSNSDFDDDGGVEESSDSEGPPENDEWRTQNPIVNALTSGVMELTSGMEKLYQTFGNGNDSAPSATPRSSHNSPKADPAFDILPDLKVLVPDDLVPDPDLEWDYEAFKWVSDEDLIADENEEEKFQPNKGLWCIASWMQQAREEAAGKKNGTDGKQELRGLYRYDAAILSRLPARVRKLAGKPISRAAKFDFRVRTFLLRFVEPYSRLPGGRKSPEKSKYLDEVTEQLFDRFPDLDPEHPMRALDKNEVKHYNEYIRAYVYQTADRLKRADQEQLRKLSSEQARTTVNYILGLVRRTAPHHLYGRSIATLVDGMMEEKKRKYLHENPNGTADIKRLQLSWLVEFRKEEFAKLGEEEQAEWVEKAKNFSPESVEDLAWLNEAAMSVMASFLHGITAKTQWHCIFMALGVTTLGAHVFVGEYGEGPNGQLFLTDDVFGSRVVDAYKEWGAKKFKKETAEISAISLPTPDQETAEAEAEEEQKASVAKAKPSKTAILPTFVPTSHRDTLEKELTKWFKDNFAIFHPARFSWTLVTQAPSKWIDINRMPMDPDYPGQLMRLQQPKLYTPGALRVLAQHIVDSYNGTLDANSAFRFKGQRFRDNDPTIPASETAISTATTEYPNMAESTHPSPRSQNEGGKKKTKKAQMKSRKGKERAYTPPAEVEEPEADFEDEDGVLEQPIDDTVIESDGSGKSIDMDYTAVTYGPLVLDHPEFQSMRTKRSELEVEESAFLQYMKDAVRRTHSCIIIHGIPPDSDSILHHREFPHAVRAFSCLKQMAVFLGDFPNVQSTGFDVQSYFIGVDPASPIASLLSQIGDQTRLVPSAYVAAQHIQRSEQVPHNFTSTESLTFVQFVDRLRLGVSEHLLFIAKDVSTYKSYDPSMALLRTVVFISRVNQYVEPTQFQDIMSTCHGYTLLHAGLTLIVYLDRVIKRVANLYIDGTQNRQMLSVWKSVRDIIDITTTQQALSLDGLLASNTLPGMFSEATLPPVLFAFPKLKLFLESVMLKPIWWNPSSGLFPNMIQLETGVDVAGAGLIEVLEDLEPALWLRFSILEKFQVCTLLCLSAIQVDKRLSSVSSSKILAVLKLFLGSLSKLPSSKPIAETGNSTISQPVLHQDPTTRLSSPGTTGLEKLPDQSQTVLITPPVDSIPGNAVVSDANGEKDATSEEIPRPPDLSNIPDAEQDDPKQQPPNTRTKKTVRLDVPDDKVDPETTEGLAASSSQKRKAKTSKSPTSRKKPKHDTAHAISQPTMVETSGNEHPGESSVPDLSFQGNSEDKTPLSADAGVQSNVPAEVVGRPKRAAAIRNSAVRAEAEARSNTRAKNGRGKRR